MISVENLSVQNGSFALGNVNFSVPSREYAVLMGKTGTGKTTVLEAICGLKPVTQGRIWIDHQEVTRLKPSQRGIGYVPQDGALFTTMTVGEHLAFSLVIRRWDRKAIARRVEELVELLGISHLLNRLPHGLSGGEAQRVSLGRALAFGSRVLCLDEPLSALDEETRAQMYELLKLVQQRTEVTALHVTHSRSEAHALADRLFVLEDGQFREAPLTGTNHSRDRPPPRQPFPASDSCSDALEDLAWESP